MEINNGINIGSLFSLNKSKSSPTAEIVEFECYSFKKISEIEDISGCLKLLNSRDDYGGVVFLFKVKKDLELLGKRFFISGFKFKIFKNNDSIPFQKQYKKNSLVNMLDTASIQRVEDNDELMQFGFLYFFEKPNDFKGADRMLIEVYLAIDNDYKSYIITKKIYNSQNNKFTTRNLNITIENKNVYGLFL